MARKFWPASSFGPARAIPKMAAFPSAAAAIENKLHFIVPQIRAIILRCGDKVSGIMQPSVDQIVQMCLDAGLAVKRNIMPRNTGIHPENRSGTRVDQANAQKLARKIWIHGYSETKPVNPMVIEKQVEGEVHDYQQATNERNFAGGTGSISPSCFRDIEYLPLKCSHTSAILNIIERGGL